MTTMLSTDPLLSPNESDDPDLELMGYELAIQKWFESTTDFQALKQKTSKELQRLGFTHWSYLRLDVPLSFSKPAGTFEQEYYKHEYDLMYQHLATSNSREPIFRSAIEQFVEQAPIETEALSNNKAVFSLYNSLGYYDCVGIPLYDYNGDNHAAFTVTTKGEKPEHFNNRVSASMDRLQIITTAFDRTGNDLYPEFFTGVKSHFEHLKNGKPLRLLEAMTRSDCGIEQAAQTIETTRTAADKQLARIRYFLDVGTTHGALLKAIKLGLIPINDKSQ